MSHGYKFLKLIKIHWVRTRRVILITNLYNIENKMKMQP
jgi:hypothetical protein